MTHDGVHRRGPRRAVVVLSVAVLASVAVVPVIGLQVFLSDVRAGRAEWAELPAALRAVLGQLLFFMGACLSAVLALVRRTLHRPARVIAALAACLLLQGGAATVFLVELARGSDDGQVALIFIYPVLLCPLALPAILTGSRAGEVAGS